MELLRKHLQPGMSLLKWGTETPGPYGHRVRVHPAVLLFLPPHAQPKRSLRNCCPSPGVLV